ncbi:MAG: hypothetical protein A3H29_15835 [Acidobacteria bacterium RIFCSPLOWO2_02_FULL_67_21]|nr:MAG: hypothetical protein A3H29_15835 [Acidobacteria bacterium RIFCSPLOWO2_02_FULL_67_21]
MIWDNLPAPYAVERYNRLADRQTFDVSVWFARRTEPGRSWAVDPSSWRFRGMYVEDPGESRASLTRFIQRCDALRPDLILSLYGERPFVVGHLIFRALGIRNAFFVERTFDAVIRRRWWKELAKYVLFRSADAAQAHAPPASQRGAVPADAFQYAYRYGFPADRVFGVTHSLDVGHHAAPLSAEMRRQLRLDLGVSGCVFLYVGRFLKTKGLLVLLDAYRRAKQQQPDISLLLVGDGADEDALRAAAEGTDGIVFVPFVQPPDLPRYYASADVFVFPSLGDTFGLVVEEAHAAGLPVITSDAAGDVRQRVRDSGNGFVVPYGDAEALAGRMVLLASDSGLRERMGGRGAERVHAWDHDAWVADFERFASSVLALQPRDTASARLTRAAGRLLVGAADIGERASAWRKKIAARGVVRTAWDTLVSRANRAGMWAISVPWRLARRRDALEKFGTEYQGWLLPVAPLGAGGICYSVGVGEDASLEDRLLKRTTCQVWSFDPTPRALAHIATRTFDPRRFTFVPVAVWDEPGHIRLFAHPDTACDTCSPVNLWHTGACFEVPCTTVGALMRGHGHDELLLLKISIGGGEWRVLQNILDDGLRVQILCVEFCQPASFWRVAAAVARLRRAGYRYCCHERWRFTFQGPPEAQDAAKVPSQASAGSANRKRA